MPGPIKHTKFQMHEGANPKEAFRCMLYIDEYVECKEYMNKMQRVKRKGKWQQQNV